MRDQPHVITDTERLDWLDYAIRQQIEGIADKIVKYMGRGATLREAIDAIRGIDF